MADKTLTQLGQIADGDIGDSILAYVAYGGVSYKMTASQLRTQYFNDYYAAIPSGIAENGLINIQSGVFGDAGLYFNASTKEMSWNTGTFTFKHGVTDNATVVAIKGNGSSYAGELRVYDEDDAEYASLGAASQTGILDLVGTAPSHWEARVGGALGNLRVADAVHVNDALNRNALGVEATREITGFTNQTDSVMSIVEATRTFSIAPASSSFDVWSKYRKITFSSQQDVVWPDTEGLHFFYLDATDDTFKTTMSFDPSQYIYGEDPFVAYLYWDAGNKVALFSDCFDERHGAQMDGATHYELHEVIGTYYKSGLALSDILTEQDGSLDTHAQFGVATGEIADEDINQTISTVASTTGLYVMYLYGASGYLRHNKVANFSVMNTGTGRLAYNEWTGATWQVSEVGNGDYVNYHIFATTANTDAKRTFAIMGQATYGNVIAARNGAADELDSLITSYLPLKEFKPLGTVLFQTSNGYSNSVKARIRSVDGGSDYIDWRSESLGTGTGASPTVHSSLTGRDAVNSHPIGAINTDVTDYALAHDDGAGNMVMSSTIKSDASGNLLLTGAKVVLDNNAEIRFKDSGGTERTALELNPSNDLYLGTSAGGNLIFVNGATYAERMRIDVSGWVGIGYTVPAGSENFAVNGTAYFNTDVRVGNRLRFAPGNVEKSVIYDDGSSNMIFETAGSEKFRIDSSGNVTLSDGQVSVNTSRTTLLNSAAAFETMPMISQDSTAQAAGVGGGITFRGNRTGAGVKSNFGAIWAEKEDAISGNYLASLVFGTANNATGYPVEAMRIDSSQNATFAGDITASKASSTLIQSATTGSGAFGAFEAKADGTGVVQVLMQGSARAGTTFGMDNASTGFIYTAGDAAGNDLGIGTYYAGDLVLGTSNTAALTIDGTTQTATFAGNVAIGISHISGQLHVGTPSANTQVRIGNNSAYDQYIYFNGNNDWSVGMDYSNSNAFNISNSSTLGTNEYLTISTGGWIGVGVSAAYGSEKFAVAGDVALVSGSAIHDGTYTAGSRLTFGNDMDLAANRHITFSPNGGIEAMRIDSNGNVGIGETLPSNLLHVKVSDTGIAPHPSAQIVAERSGTNYLQMLTGSTETSGILFGDSGDIDVGSIKYDHNLGAMQFGVEAKQQLRLNSTGTVFGTHDGQQEHYFERYSGAAPYAYLYSGFADNDVASGWQIRGRNSDGALYSQIVIVGRADTATTTAIHIDGNGFIGLNGYAAPVGAEAVAIDGNLLVNNTVYFGTDSDQYIRGDASSNYLQFVAANQEAMRIDSNQRLIIGDSAVGSQNSILTTQTDGACAGEFETVAGSGGYIAFSISGSAKALLGAGGNIGLSNNNNIALRSASGSLTFQTGGDNDRMIIDSDGRVGLRTTPENWGSTYSAMQIGGNFGIMATAAQGAGGLVDLTQNAYFDGVNWKYISTDETSRYRLQGGKHIWSYAASDTAGNTVTWFESMRTGSSGELLIGATSQYASEKLGVNGDVYVNGTGGNLVTIKGTGFADLVIDSTAGDTFVTFADNTTGKVKMGWDYSASAFKCNVSAASFTPNDFVIDTSGNVGIGTASPTFVANYGGLHIARTGTTYPELRMTTTNTGTTSTDGFTLSVNSASNVYIWNYESAGLYFGTANTTRMSIASDGGITMNNLPTSDPSVAGELWNDSGTVKISAG